MTLPDTSSPQIAPEERLYRTPDQGLAATLLALGFSLTGGERSPRGVAVFVFRWHPDLDGAVASYWTDQLAVNPKALCYAYAIVHAAAEAHTGDIPRRHRTRRHPP